MIVIPKQWAWLNKGIIMKTEEQQKLCDALEAIELSLANIALAIKEIRRLVEAV